MFSVGRRVFLAHRVSLALAGGELVNGALACHRCDNSWCVNPEHLYVGTHTDNSRDAWGRGRQRARGGAESPSAKLTEEQAREIKRLMRDPGNNKATVAARFGITPAAAYFIHRGWTWKALGGDDAHR